MTNSQLTDKMKNIIVDVGRDVKIEVRQATPKVDLKKEQLAVPQTSEEKAAKLMATLDKIDSELAGEVQNFDGFKEFTDLPKRTSVQRWMSDLSQIPAPSNSDPNSSKE